MYFTAALPERPRRFMAKLLTVSRIAIIVLAAIVASAASKPLLAQQEKTLRGAIRDPLGALITNASVDLVEDGRAIAHARSDKDGTFQFSLPQSGRYSVVVSAPSFQATSSPTSFYTGSPKDELAITLATATLTQQITVTATGTPIPQAQIGASVTVLRADGFRYMPEVQDPLRLVPGLQFTQVGQMGGTSGLSIRGGATDANKVLIDGVPANQIGGVVEFSNLATVGVNSIEVLREPNSALYGSDALAGVVSITSARGSTPLPLLTYSGDAGNFRTYRNEISAGAAYRQFDLYSAFARIDTENNIPNSKFHNDTYVGNFGWRPDPANDLRFTVHHVIVSGGQPNAIAFFAIADDGQQKEQDDSYGAVWNDHPALNWHNQIRYGGLRQNGQYSNFGSTGIPDGLIPGVFDGAPVNLVGANGYAVTGQARFQYSSSFSQTLSITKRDFVYAQTDYRLTHFIPHLLALGAFKYENETGSSISSGYTPNAIQRGNYSYTLQFSGDVRNRLFYNLGTGLEDNGLFGFAGTPRASLAYYLVRPSAVGLFTGTKLYGSFGKGIKEPSVYQQANSLYGVLNVLPNGSQFIQQYNVATLGPENSRTFDGGLDQQLLSGRGRLGITYFHNVFTNGVEYVPPSGLLALGVPVANLSAFQYVGAYLNSSAFRSQGAELELEFKVTNHLFARGGYTYTDAVVRHSFSTDNLGPSFNTSSKFSTIPIGAYSPLVGARPFRIAPHTGYFAFDYAHTKWNASFTGTLVGRRDDSDFLCDNTQPNYLCGTSLLLPNRNLDGAYQRLELGGGYQLTPRIYIYANIENLLSEHYYEAFGFPALPLTFRTGIKLHFGGESWKLN